MLFFRSSHRRSSNSREGTCSVTTEDVHGLTLWRLKSRGSQSQLCVIFGLISSTVSDWFNYGLKVLYQTLKSSEHPAFQVQWPAVAEMKESARLLEDNRPNKSLLRNVFAVVDGERFPCADYVDSDIQNGYYKSYTYTVNISNLLVYTFKREIVYEDVHFSNTCHEGKLSNLSGLVFLRFKMQ